MLGQGALTSPGHFRNAAQPIARPTARNRAIAHTRVPSDAVRSCPDHHPLDIHGAEIGRTAHTTGCELLDVVRYDHHSGPGRKRPQFAITKDRILASDADAIIAWTVSRFPAQLAGARRGTPSCCMAVKHASERFATRFFRRASDCSSTAGGSARAHATDPQLSRCSTAGCARTGQRPARMRSLPASFPTRGKGTQRVATGRVRESLVGRTAARYDQAVARTANTANTAAARRRAAAQLRGMFADVARDRFLVDELIAERRAEAVAEDRAADAPQPRPGG